MSRETWLYKKRAIRAAKELKYSAEVQKKLNKATSDAEISRIMCNARSTLILS